MGGIRKVRASPWAPERGKESSVKACNRGSHGHSSGVLVYNGVCLGNAYFYTEFLSMMAENIEEPVTGLGGHRGLRASWGVSVDSPPVPDPAV